MQPLPEYIRQPLPEYIRTSPLTFCTFSETGEMTKEKIVLFLSDYVYVDTIGKEMSPKCGCDPKKAAIRRYTSCKCGKDDRKCVISSYGWIPMQVRLHSYSSAVHIFDGVRREAKL